jgi:hypothetical protein
MNETNERLVRLNDLRGGFWAIDTDRVVIEDLLDGPREGKIVRVYGNPADCIKFFFYSGVEADAIAGWVSEDE